MPRVTKTSGIGTIIDEQHELQTGALDLFSLPPADTSLHIGKHQVFYPESSNLANYEQNIIFTVVNDTDEYIQLDMTKLAGEIVFTKADGTTVLAADQKISVVNNFPQSLFRQVEVYLNNFCVSDLATGYYHYKAYIENHFSYDDDIKNTTLMELEHYIKDTPTKETAYEDETGLQKRGEIVMKKNVFFKMAIHNDFLKSTKLLMPGVELKIVLIRNNPTMTIVAPAAAADTFKMTLKDIQLHIRKVTLSSGKHSAIERGLQIRPSLYPIAHSKITMHSIPQGSSNFPVPHLIRGRLPRHLIFFLVTEDAHNGVLKNNLFKFTHYNVNYINLMINGDPIVNNGLRYDFTTGAAIYPYSWMLDNIGLKGSISIGLSLKDFVENSTIFPFDLTADLNNNVYAHKVLEGQIDLHIAFKTATTTVLNLMTYATYDEIVVIDKDRNVTIEYPKTTH
jgi:hypothetical protein